MTSLHGGRCRVYTGDVLECLREVPSESVDCCVSSPPYWGLRDYGVAGQIGLEATPAEYVAKVVEVYHEVRRVLKKSGTCWVNLGDTYSPDGKAGGRGGCKNYTSVAGGYDRGKGRRAGLQSKNRLMIPARVAIALQDDGWWLRDEIVWHKPNPMPESVRDRCTCAHEMVYMLTKAKRYYYDQDAVAQPCSPNTHMRLAQHVAAQIGSRRANGGTRPDRPMKAVGKVTQEGSGIKNNESFVNACCLPVETRNMRSVWKVPTQPYPEAHFATYPEDLVKPMILAGCPEGGVVLDPFLGSGTTAAVAVNLGRQAIGIELNPGYVELACKRICAVTPSLFAEVPA